MYRVYWYTEEVGGDMSYFSDFNLAKGFFASIVADFDSVTVMLEDSCGHTLEYYDSL